MTECSGDCSHSRHNFAALKYCRAQASALGLPMKFIDVDFRPSGDAVTFFFTAPERVDFRELVRILGKHFKLRVNLRQIGVRDAAKLIDGVGPCGQRLCCAAFLQKFRPIALRRAKDQGLSAERFAGVCGRLKCCLEYEAETYSDAKKWRRRIGKQVVTPQGPGRLLSVDAQGDIAEVHLQNDQKRDNSLAQAQPSAGQIEALPAETGLIERFRLNQLK